MADAKKIILVEGESDKSFFEEVCKVLKLDTKIRVAPPRDVGGAHNSKEGVFNHLSNIVPLLDQGQLTHLAVVMDADYKNDGGLGCQATINKMIATLAPFGFSLKKNSDPKISGLVFEHNDGLNPIGLWVMANNHDDGMLEDWMKLCISASEKTLFQHAVTITKALPQQNFKEIHRSKAEIATWLAWQAKPDRGAYYALSQGGFDSTSPAFQQLASWLRLVFQ
ncbi:hypothetical protein BH11PSE12_BH11PSE12_33670 [soil metagenome]